MNRKLLQDQPLKKDIDDLESIKYGDKQDKKVTFDPKTEQEESKTQKEKTQGSKADELASLRSEFAAADKRDRKPNHHIQILDEDAEHFRNKLDEMINKFKTETMSEFMSMKRGLLEEQQETIDMETQKYTRILENRNTELDTVKHNLATKIKQLERSEVILHVMARWCGEAKVRQRNTTAIAKYFAQFKLYREYMIMKRKITKIAVTHSRRNYLRMFFTAWKDQRAVERENKLKASFDDQLQRDLSDLAAKYNKEIDLLSQKLKEANDQLEIANKQKLDMQENLKKAFMRGVCALNFEAMSVLQLNGQTREPFSETLAERGVREANTLYSQQAKTSHRQQFEEPEYDKENYANPLIVNPIADDNQDAMYTSTQTKSSPAKKSVVFYQNPRLESKEARWKDAPLVGSMSSTKQETQQPKPKLSDYMQRSPTSKQQEFAEKEYRQQQVTFEQEEEPEEQDEGKVIRVTAGKSHVGGAKKPATQTSQVRSQLAKKSTAAATTTAATIKKK